MLRTLDIGKNAYDPQFHISILSEGETFMGSLTHLRYLNIEDIHVRHFPDFLRTLGNLQFLELYWCRNIETLPQEMNHLSNLHYLRLRKYTLSSLPESIFSLGQLQVLDLGACDRLEQLPKDMGNLKKLRTLVLRGARMTSLPESICALSQLQDLDLGDCDRLEQLPEHMGNMRSLRTLFIHRITSFPESICALSQLQDLDLFGGRFEQLPKDIGNLRSLRKLCLTNCFILISLPESICALSQSQVLELSSCDRLKQLPKDMIGNIRSLHKLDLTFTELEQLPLHIGKLTRLEELPVYHVGKEEGQRLSELKLMNRLKDRLTIASMADIESVEDASMADLKSKTNIHELKFHWSRPGNDEEMTVRILEALKPHCMLRLMTIKNYGGHKFPDWIMSSNICVSNLAHLTLEGINKICEMLNMEFVSLESLHIENCPRLRKVLIATPKLIYLALINLKALEADSVHFLPNLHLVFSQLHNLSCTYNFFEYFYEKLQATDLKRNEFFKIVLDVGGARLASLPRGWLTMMGSIEILTLNDIGPGKFQLLPDGDESIFPPSIRRLTINDKLFREHKLPHHSFTINSDGKIASEGVIQK